MYWKGSLWKSILYSKLSKSIVTNSKASNNMVFTAIQNKSFFTDAVQMGLSVQTRQALVNEWISMADDLHEWEDDEWDQFSSNCKWPPQIVDPNNSNLLINQAPFLVPIKYLKILKEASRIARFYKAFGRPLSQQKMRWQHVTEK